MTVKYVAICNGHEWKGTIRGSEDEARSDLEEHFEDPKHLWNLNDDKEFLAPPISGPHAVSYIEEIREVQPYLLDHPSSPPDTTESSLEPLTYGYSFETNLALGSTFNPCNLYDIKRGAITFKEKKLDQGPPHAEIEFFYVSDFESFQTVLKVDASVSASYLLSSFDHTNKRVYESAFTKTSATVVLRGFADHGRWGLPAEAELIVPAKEVLNDPARFAEMFGTRYIAVEHRMCAVFAVITVYSISYSLKKSLEQSTSFGIGYAPLKGLVKEAFASEISKASRENRIQVRVFTQGGKGLSDLRDFIIAAAKDENGFTAAVENAVKTGLDGLTEDLATPYLYAVANMRNFGLLQDLAPAWSGRIAEKLANLKADYDRYSYELDIASRILKKDHVLYLIGGYATNDELLKSLATAVNEGKQRIESIAAKHAQLRRGIDVDYDHVDHHVIPEEVLAALEPPIMNFKGYLRLKGLPLSQEEIPIERLNLLLDTLPYLFGPDREQLVRNLYPSADMYRIEIAVAPQMGLSTLQLYVESSLRIKYGVPIPDGLFTDIWKLYSGDTSHAFLLDGVSPNPMLEESILHRFRTYTLSIPPLAVGTFEGKLMATVVDKADRRTTLVLMEFRFDAQHGQIINSSFKMKYNVTQR